VKAYLSGPITGIADWRERFAQAAEYVGHLGAEVINPASLEPPVAKPSWADYLIYDLTHLRHANVLVLLPGAEASPGALVEKAFALGLGIPIVDLAELRAHLAQSQRGEA
jgi:hypothetical protein